MQLNESELGRAAQLVELLTDLMLQLNELNELSRHLSSPSGLGLGHPPHEAQPIKSALRS